MEEDHAKDPDQNDVSYYIFEQVDWENLHRNIDKDDMEKIELLKKFNPKGWQEEIQDMCDIQHTHGISSRSNEIESWGIGEHSFQLPEDVVEELEGLSDDEFDEVTRSLDMYVSKRDRSEGSINMENDRFSAILDTEQLEERVKQLLDEKFDDDFSKIQDKIEADNIDVSKLEIEDSEAGNPTMFYTKHNPETDDKDKIPVYTVNFKYDNFIEDFLHKLQNPEKKETSKEKEAEQPAA
jgi:hypothetical protein